MKSEKDQIRKTLNVGKTSWGGELNRVERFSPNDWATRATGDTAELV
jgi:hypothetical protein